MLNKLAVHPILLPLALLLSVYVNYTIDQPFSGAITPILACLAGAAAAWFLAARIIHDPAKAALTATLGGIWLFAFGPFATALYALGEIQSLVAPLIFLLETQPGRLILLGAWSLVFLLAIFFLLRSKSQLRSLPAYLNLLSIILFGFVLVGWGQAGARKTNCNQPAGCSSSGYYQEADPIPQAAAGSRTPDIYYIILDGYARQDILSELYHYDDQPFINQLEEMGFYIARQSQANYNRTIYSLPSSLNMSLLTSAALENSMGGTNMYTLHRAAGESRLVDFLRLAGYQPVFYLSEYNRGTSNPGLLYKAPRQQLAPYLREVFTTSALAPLFPDYLYQVHRQQILYVLDSLPGEAEDRQPAFVFAHILAPHPPFVFTATGAGTTPRLVFGPWDAERFISRLGKPAYMEGYAGQLEYISGRILAMVQEILARSPQPPIIILQGDHGPRSEGLDGSISPLAVKETTSILNAYYFPDQDYASLYPSISPVNSFRVVLNQYFQTGLPLLEDEVHVIPE